MYDFLLVRHCNYSSILYRLRVIWRWEMTVFRPSKTSYRMSLPRNRRWQQRWCRLKGFELPSIRCCVGERPVYVYHLTDSYLALYPRPTKQVRKAAEDSRLATPAQSIHQVWYKIDCTAVWSDSKWFGRMRQCLYVSKTTTRLPEVYS